MNSKKIIRLGIFELRCDSNFVNETLLNNGQLVAFCDRNVERTEKADESFAVCAAT